MTHEEQRMQLWRDVAVAVARAETSRSDDVPASWADKALAAFDKKFPKPVAPKRFLS